MKGLLTLILPILLLGQSPVNPVWPSIYQADFFEKTVLPYLHSVQNTTGTVYYDYSSLQFRIDRVNGRFDRLCGLNGNKVFIDTPCSQIVNEGQRFLYYPELGECCFCCGEEDGCGMLEPGWLQNASFIGETTLEDGLSAYEWEAQPYLYYESTESDPMNRVILELDQGSEDIQEFFNMQKEVPAGYLDLPTICDPSVSCAELSECSATRVSRD